MNRQSSERAAVLFLLAVIVVPLLLILSTAWFDLQKFSTERSELQTKVDLAVTQAAAQLPYSYLATRVAHQALSAQGISASKVIVQPGSVEITVEADSKLIFAPFIGLSMSQEELKKLAMDLSSIHYSVSARATSTRKVALIYLDTGHYLAPEIDDPSNEAWGDLGRPAREIESSAGHWPASALFKNIAVQRAKPNFARLYTQQCYNPAFSALKEAGIRLYDYLSATPSNRVGVYAGSSLFEITPLSERAASGDDRGLARFRFFPNQESSSCTSGATVRDEYCLAAAEHEVTGSSGHAGFEFPIANSDLPAGQFKRNAPLYVTDEDSCSLMPGNVVYMQVREAMWSLAVERADSGKGGNHPSIPQVVGMLGKRLLREAQIDRLAGVETPTSYAAYILLGSLNPAFALDPGPSATDQWRRTNCASSDSEKEKADCAFNKSLQDLATQLTSLNAMAKLEAVTLRLYIVNSKHMGVAPKCPDHVSGLEPDCWGFYARSTQFDAFLNKNSERWPLIQVIHARPPNSDSLAQGLMTTLPLVDKVSILER